MLLDHVKIRNYLFFAFIDAIKIDDGNLATKGGRKRKPHNAAAAASKSKKSNKSTASKKKIQSGGKTTVLKDFFVNIIHGTTFFRT